MRLPQTEHTSRPWRIREIAHDFQLEDVWALPVHGGRDDFQSLLDMMLSLDPESTASPPTRLLFRFRRQLGRWFGWDDAGDEPPILGTNEYSLTNRLPDDLRDTAFQVRFASLPFVPLYRTAREFAAEASNQTMHGVIHLAWLEQGEGRYQGQMAIYVKPRGLFGKGYMALIKPFRYFIVYPALMRQIARAWKARSSSAVRSIEPVAIHETQKEEVQP
jgi:hypothetical protein